ncbi:ribonuclease 3-like [Sarcoptes scabiei]|nr:ribonuclease 3-like [Sarcoptes scabiei]
MFKFSKSKLLSTTTFLVALSLLSLLIKPTESKCPSKANSFCLQVDGFDSILLDGSHFTNISKVFKQIAFLFENDNEAKELDQLILINNFKLEKLDRNVFCDFRFRRIVIQNCTRLNKVDRDAFNGTEKFVRSLTINSIGLNEATTEDFFEALNSLENLEELELKNHRILNIKEYTFRQKQLKLLHLDGPLETIHNNAFFYADNIRILKLTRSIRRIKQHAFHLRLASNKTLDIYLDAKIGNIERRTFLSTPRPLTINLYLNKLGNFDPVIFRPILMLPIKHELILNGSPKEMRRPCQLLWLFRNKHRFKGVFMFKDEPLIDENYFDQWRCSDQIGHVSSDTGPESENELVHEEMNSINRAGIDASYNREISIVQSEKISSIVLIATTLLISCLI